MHILHLDDHNLFRKGVEKCLTESFNHLHIQAFSDNTTALEYVQHCRLSNNKIDVIITDYNHVGGNGLTFAEAVRTIEKEYKDKTLIIMLTMRDDEELKQATANGILDAYFTKDIPCEDLVDFIRQRFV